MDSTCSFCTELSHYESEFNLLESILKPSLSINSRIIYQTENFVVMPTFGCFIEGYVLIVSKEHFDCMGKIPTGLNEELYDLINKVRISIDRTYQLRSVVFEHGAVSCFNKFGGCVNHSHIHVVPCDGTILDEVKLFGCDFIEVPDIKELSQRANSDTSYLFLIDVDQKMYFIENDVMPSQFLRKILAHKCGVVEQWDWRQHFFLDKMSATILNLRIG